jgi:localization factor PodJL
LRGIGRRLDTSERSHNDSNRFLSRTAQEMNANAREQAQAFDQLGQTMGSLRERLERLERSAPGNNIREAIKALHLGLSRLADQLTVAAGKSAGQLAEVMGNIEKLAVHIGKVREDSDSAARLLNQRIDLAQDELAQRLQDGEKSLAARLSAAEKTTLFNTNALDHALEKIEAAATARAAELAENQRRASHQEEILRELKDNLAQLEARLPGLKLESRLNGIERSIGGLKEAVAQRDPALAFGATVQDLAQRLERLERDQAGLSDALHMTPAEDAAASQFPHASLEPLVEVPPEPHTVVLDLPQEEMPAGEALQPPEATEQDIAMPAFFFASESEEPVPQEDALEDRHMAFAPRDYAFNPQAEEDEPDILFQDVIVESNPDALLAEARRSAQAALERAEDERIFRRPSFHAGEVATDDEESPRPRYWIPLAAILVLAIVASAALVLSQRAKRLGEELAASNPVAEKIPVLPMLPPGKPMVAPAAGASASEPDGDQTAEIPPTARKVEHATLSADANQPAAIAASPGLHQEKMHGMDVIGGRDAGAVGGALVIFALPIADLARRVVANDVMSRRGDDAAGGHYDGFAFTAARSCLRAAPRRRIPRR